MAIRSVHEPAINRMFSFLIAVEAKVVRAAGDVFESSDFERFIDRVLGHFSKGSPFPARDGDES